MRSGRDVERPTAKDFEARKVSIHNGNDVDLADSRFTGHESGAASLPGSRQESAPQTAWLFGKTVDYRSAFCVRPCHFSDRRVGGHPLSNGQRP